MWLRDRPTARVVVVAASWVLACVLLSVVVVAAELAPEEVPSSPDLGVRGWLLGLGMITCQAVVLGWRRNGPESALIMVCAVVALAAALGLAAATGVTSVAVFVAVYFLVVDRPWPRPLPVLGVAVVLVAAGELLRQVRADEISGVSTGTALLQAVTTVGLPAAVGVVVGARREAGRARAEQARASAGEQAALVQAAVARERTAMARELHDIAAHHLSGIAVMTGAIDRQIDTDPAGAKAAVRQVRQQSTAMLKDLRGLVVLLREEDLVPGRVEVESETLAGVATLVDSARRAGRNVELRVVGTAQSRLSDLDVGPLAQLSAYRTVQESLANAARHAPGARCEVVVDATDPTMVSVTVRNDPPPQPARTPAARSDRAPNPSGGFGILGMRERAELTGAHLTYGPTSDGGWSVSLTLPTEVLTESRPQPGSDGGLR